MHRPKSRARISLPVAALALGLVVAACGGSSASAQVAPVSAAPASAAPAQAPAGGAAVTIQGFAFSPTTLTVAVGATVTWTNDDTTTHTATADDGSFDAGKIAPGQTATATFSKAGTFAYHCTIHPQMKATIVVQ